MKVLFQKGHKPIKGCFGKGSKHTDEYKKRMSEIKKRAYAEGKISPYFTTKGFNIFT